MAIYLIDDNDNLGQLATTQGHRDLIKWVESNGDAWPALQEFAASGESEDIAALTADTKEAVKACEVPDVKSTLQNLVDLLQKAEGGVTAA